MNNDSVLVKLDDPVSIVYCHDPIHPDDRETIILPCGPGQMLIDYLDASGFLYDEGFVVSINGAEITSKDWAVTDVMAGDCIVIMPRIGAPLIPLIGMAAAFGAAQTGLTGIYLFATQTAIMLGSAVLMNALMPQPPKMDGENDG